jgi:hypothetical protein
VRVFSSNRGRPAKVGKGGRKHVRVQLNARVPEQLALEFNEAAPRGGRDTLVVTALERLLAERGSDARPRTGSMRARDTAKIDRISSDREAIELIRYHAAAILQIASRAANARKGPKAVERNRSRSRKKGELA